MFYLTMQSALYFPDASSLDLLCHEKNLEQFLTREKIEKDIRNIHQSVFGVYGLELIQSSLLSKKLLDFDLTILEYKANHSRACLDILEYNEIPLLNGKLKEMFSNKEQLNEFFIYAKRLKDSSFWNKIDKFFQAEVTEEWKEFNQIKKVIRFK